MYHLLNIFQSLASYLLSVKVFSCKSFRRMDSDYRLFNLSSFEHKSFQVYHIPNPRLLSVNEPYQNQDLIWSSLQNAVLLSWDWCLFILHIFVISIITRCKWDVLVFHWSTDTIRFSRIRTAFLPRPGNLSFLYFDRKHISSFNLVYQVFNMICHIFYVCLASQLTLPSSHACSIWQSWLPDGQWHTHVLLLLLLFDSDHYQAGDWRSSETLTNSGHHVPSTADRSNQSSDAFPSSHLWYFSSTLQMLLLIVDYWHGRFPSLSSSFNSS